MNEFEYLVIGRDAQRRPCLMRQRAFDTRDEAIRYALGCSPSHDVQVVPIVRAPSRSWIDGPYPSCSTPALCREKGYCRRDPACDD